MTDGRRTRLNFSSEQNRHTLLSAMPERSDAPKCSSVDSRIPFTAEGGGWGWHRIHPTTKTKLQLGVPLGNMRAIHLNRRPLPLPHTQLQPEASGCSASALSGADLVRKGDVCRPRRTVSQQRSAEHCHGRRTQDHGRGRHHQAHSALTLLSQLDPGAQGFRHNYL